MYMSWTRWVRGQVESCRRRSREEGSPELLGRQGLGEQPRAGVNLKLGFTSAVGSTHTLPRGRWWFFDGGIPVDPLPCLSPPPSVAGDSRSSLADISLYLPDKGTSCACACLSAWVYLLSSWPPCRHLDQCVIRRVLSTCLGLWNPLPMTVCKLHRRDKMRKSAHEPLEPGVTQAALHGLWFPCLPWGWCVNRPDQDTPLACSPWEAREGPTFQGVSFTRCEEPSCAPASFFHPQSPKYFKEMDFAGWHRIISA